MFYQIKQSQEDGYYQKINISFYKTYENKNAIHLKIHYYNEEGNYWISTVSATFLIINNKICDTAAHYLNDNSIIYCNKLINMRVFS